jgi:hypothetical protein
LEAAGQDADANAGTTAVDDPATSCDETPTVGDLTVRLLHACDKSPISGGTVRITGPQAGESNTDAKGLANFKGVKPGSYQIDGTQAQHLPGKTNGDVAAAKSTTVDLVLSAVVKAAPVHAEHSVVLDKNGRAPATFPILQFQITNGPPNHLFEVQLSRGGTGDLTGGPGLAGSWVEADGRDARFKRAKFSSWSNGQKTLQLDGSGNATFIMPLEWWRDQARQPRSTFTDFTYFFRVITFKAGPTPVCAFSSADGSGSAPSVKLHNNLVSFRIQDLGYIAGGTKKSIQMEGKTKEPNTSEMYTFVQWKVGGRELWSGTTPAMTRPTVQDYNVIHESNYPVSQIDRLGTNPRYHDGNYTVSADGLTFTSSDAPSNALPAGATAAFTHIDFDTRVHLNFEVPAAVKIAHQDGSAPTFGVVTGVLDNPQPITLDAGAWNARILQRLKADGTPDAPTHPDTFAGP